MDVYKRLKSGTSSKIKTNEDATAEPNSGNTLWSYSLTFSEAGADIADFVFVFRVADNNAYVRAITTVYSVGRAGIGILAQPLSPGMLAPPVPQPTLENAIMLLYMALRNKTETTGSTFKLYHNDGSVIGQAALTDTGTTLTRGVLS